MPEYKKLKKPGKSNGRTWMVAEVKYPRMPQKMESLGPKRITLTFYEPRRGKWNYYQKVELFFHYKGKGNPGGKHPNWFYYWAQVRSPRAGTGNAKGVNFEPGPRWDWMFRGAGRKTEVRASLSKECCSLSGFRGMVKHEEKHETDFFEVIWEKGGYQGAKDGDKDGIRNDWETVKGDWEDKGHYWDDRGGFGDTTKGFGYYFETTRANFAWSDVRADAAAKNEVDGNLKIDSKDWSDLRVTPLIKHVFRSKRGSPDPKKHVFKSKPTEAGNNKHWRPEVVR